MLQFPLLPILAVTVKPGVGALRRLNALQHHCPAIAGAAARWLQQVLLLAVASLLHARLIQSWQFLNSDGPSCCWGSARQLRLLRTRIAHAFLMGGRRCLLSSRQLPTAFSSRSGSISHMLCCSSMGVTRPCRSRRQQHFCLRLTAFHSWRGWRGPAASSSQQLGLQIGNTHSSLERCMLVRLLLGLLLLGLPLVVLPLLFKLLLGCGKGEQVLLQVSC